MDGGKPDPDTGNETRLVKGQTSSERFASAFGIRRAHVPDALAHMLRRLQPFVKEAPALAGIAVELEALLETERRRQIYEVGDVTRVTRDIDSPALLALTHPTPAALHGRPERADFERRELGIFLRAILQCEPVPAGVADGLVRIRAHSVAAQDEARALAQPADSLSALAAKLRGSRQALALEFIREAITPTVPRVAQPRSMPNLRREPKYRNFFLLRRLMHRFARMHGLASEDELILPQLVQIAATIAADLRQPDRRKLAIGLLLITFTGLLPAQWKSVRLGTFRNDGELWLDLLLGLVYLSLAALAGTKVEQTIGAAGVSRDVVPVPVAVEIIDYLLEEQQSRVTAALDLYELMVVDAAFVGQLERYCHRISKFAWTITFGRLARGVPPLLRDEIGEALAVDMLTWHSGLINLSNVHYLSVTADELASAAPKAFQMLGLSGRLACDVPDHVASLRPAPSDDVIAAFLATALPQIEPLFELPPVAGVTEMVRRIGRVARPLLATLDFVEGLRGARIESICFANMSFARMEFIVADKFSNQFRFVPVPVQLIGWIERYRKLIFDVAFRLRNNHPALSRTLKAHATASSMLPMFITVSETGEVVPLTSADLADELTRWGIHARNDGRRVLHAWMRKQGYSVHDENCVTGRYGGSGGDPYGPYSRLCPAALVERVRPALESFLDSVGFPASPRVKHSRYEEPPSLSALPKLPANMVRPCRFDEMPSFVIREADPFRLDCYAHALRKFRQCPPSDPLIALAMTAVFESGAFHADELIEAVVCAASRQDVLLHRDHAFVHTRADSLGLRELVLGQTSVCFFGRVPHQVPDRNDLRRHLERAAADLTRDVGGKGLDDLLDASAALATYALPGPIREFTLGRLAPRTPSFQARARWESPHGSAIGVPWVPSQLPARTSGSSLLESGFEVQTRVITRVLNEADRSVGEAQRRLAAQTALSKFLTTQLCPGAALLVKVLLHISRSADMPSSLIRYIWPLRRILGGFAPEDEDDFPTRADIDRLQRLIEADRQARSHGSEGDRNVNEAAYGYLLQVCNVHAMRDTSRPVFTEPVDFMCEHEITLGTRRLTELQSVPTFITDRALIYWLIKTRASNRVDEIARLRRCDLYLEEHEDGRAVLHVAVTTGAKARLKRRAARRVFSVLLAGDELVVLKRVLSVVGDRERIFPDFAIAQIRELAESAQRHVTGNAELNGMTFRRAGNNLGLLTILMPSTPIDSYAERTMIVAFAKQSGHSPYSAVHRYFALMGEARSAWMKALPAPFRFAASPAILAVANAQLQDSVRRRFDRAKHAGREVGTGRIRSLHKMPPELLSLAPAQPDALTTDGTFVVDADTMKYALRRCFGYAGPEAGAAVKVDRKHAVRLDAVIDRWQIERPGLSVLKSPSPAVIDLASTMCHRLARRMDATLASDAWLAIRPHEGGIGVDPSKVQTPALRLLVQEAEALGVTARLCVSSKPSAATYQAARLLSKQLESRLARTPLARDWPWIAFKAPGTNARTSVALVASSIAAAIALRKDHQ